MTFLGCIPDLPHSHDLETFQGIFFAFYKEDTEKRPIRFPRDRLFKGIDRGAGHSRSRRKEEGLSAKRR